jgi:2-methylcitrate dehydratase PrpD
LKATKTLVDFISKTEYEHLPPKAIDNAKQCILDCIGVTLAGCTQHPIHEILQSYVIEIGGNPKSSIIGSGFKTSLINAALVNGILGHVLDYDDFALPALSHPSVTVLPAVLALGEAKSITGKDALLSFILGFEAFCKIADAVQPSHWYKGYHATGTFGTFGASVAASKILRLDDGRLTNALGIAGSEAAGLKQNFGTMTKPFHAGQAAENGIRAALLAQKGFTSAPDILEGRLGFAKVMTDKYDFAVFDKLGNPWDIVDPAPFIKLHPSCGGTHASMNTILYLIKEHDIKPDEVEHVYAGTNPGGGEQLIYTEPKNRLQAKFSIQFCLAIMLLERKAGLAQFTDSKVNDPKTVELMKRITLYVDPEVTESTPLEWSDKTAKVKVKMKDGREFQKMTDIRHPTWNEIISKYEECAREVLPENKIKRSIDLVSNLEELRDLSPLIEAIQK